MDSNTTFRTAAIWIATALAVFLLWKLRLVLLLAFAAVLTAIMLRVLMHWIGRVTRMGDGPALALAILLVLGIGLGTVWLFGAQISQQFGEMMDRMQTAQHTVTGLLKGRGIDVSDVQQQATSYLTGMVKGLLSYSLDILEGLIVLVISAIYMAAQPELYRRGAALLFGRSLRGEAVEGLNLIGTSLKLWLLAQLILMVIVGVLSFVACWLLGLPSPVALGLIAGITEMVPYIGPFIGGIPAVLVALTQGVHLAFWTVGAYLVIHVIEGYLVAPPLERHFVRIPPALVLLGILAAEMIFGPFGMIVAAPLTAAIFIAVKVFYVRDTLKEDTEIPEHSPL